ncbi:MAG: glycosyltransferase [Saprospiraceae bacterium]|nr:glycosyltransferase [Saprospiraceae bacterium]
MHILFIPAWFETPAHPTAGKAVKDLAYALALEGVKVNFLFQSGASLPFRSSLNHQIEIWHSRSVWPGLLFPIWNRVGLWSYHKIFKQYLSIHGVPDLIHIHNYNLLPVACLLFKKYGTRIVYTEHSSKMAQQKLSGLEKYLVKRYTGDYIQWVAVSEYLKSGIKVLLPDVPVKVIPNTVDFNYFKPGPKSNSPQLIMVNLLNKNKQVDQGIKVFSVWKKKHPEAHLHIIGDGPERKKLEILAKSYGVQDQIIWWGEKPVEDWLAQLQASTCLLFLSRSESFGVVVLESLACEIPVVCLQNKGIEEIPVGDQIPVLPLDADELQIAGSIDLTINRFNPEVAREMRNVLRARFDYPVVAKQYISLYKNFLNAAQ